MLAFRGVNSVFYNRVNSANISEYTLAMKNTMLPFEFRKGKI